MTEQAKAKTNQEKLDALKVEQSNNLFELGVKHYNLEDKEAQVKEEKGAIETLHIKIKNTIVDLNKLAEILKKEKAAEEASLSLVPSATQEVSNAVQ